MTPPLVAVPLALALGVDPDDRLAYALTFPFRSGWEAAVFWGGVLVALAWHLVQRRTRSARWDYRLAEARTDAEAVTRTYHHEADDGDAWGA